MKAYFDHDTQQYTIRIDNDDEAIAVSHALTQGAHELKYLDTPMPTRDAVWQLGHDLRDSTSKVDA